jgi:hypothetical protein
MEYKEYERMLDPSYVMEDIEEITFKRKDYRSRVEIDKRMVDDLKRRGEFKIIEDVHSHARESMAWEMKVAIYEKDHPQKHVVRYPSDWWEALKERFAPSWFLGKYPVKFTEVTASLEELYPDLEIAIPNQSPVLKFRVSKNSVYPI